MALFVLRKLILHPRMRSHPVGLGVWFLVGPFVYFHSSCVRTAKALAISTIVSWAGSLHKFLNGSFSRFTNRNIPSQTGQHWPVGITVCEQLVGGHNTLSHSTCPRCWNGTVQALDSWWYSTLINQNFKRFRIIWYSTSPIIELLTNTGVKVTFRIHLFKYSRRRLDWPPSYVLCYYLNLSNAPDSTLPFSKS